VGTIQRENGGTNGKRARRNEATRVEGEDEANEQCESIPKEQEGERKGKKNERSRAGYARLGCGTSWRLSVW